MIGLMVEQLHPGRPEGAAVDDLAVLLDGEAVDVLIDGHSDVSSRRGGAPSVAVDRPGVMVSSVTDGSTF